MRETYPLSEATRKTLAGNVPDFADETHKADKYFYAILAGNEPDVFARFEPLYAAACRLSINCHWKAKLEAIEARYAPFMEATEPSECVREKVMANTRFLDKFIDAMSDGNLDLREVLQLEPLVDEAARSIEKLQAALTFRRGLLEAENDKASKSKRNGFPAGNGARR